VSKGRPPDRVLIHLGLGAPFPGSDARVCGDSLHRRGCGKGTAPATEGLLLGGGFCAGESGFLELLRTGHPSAGSPNPRRQSCIGPNGAAWRSPRSWAKGSWPRDPLHLAGDQLRLAPLSVMSPTSNQSVSLWPCCRDSARALRAASGRRSLACRCLAPSSSGHSSRQRRSIAASATTDPIKSAHVPCAGAPRSRRGSTRPIDSRHATGLPFALASSANPTKDRSRGDACEAGAGPQASDLPWPPASGRSSFRKSTQRSAPDQRVLQLRPIPAHRSRS